MAEGRSLVQRALKLQERLRCTQQPTEILKTLKVLQDLDITLDILVETGIGRTVNGFRKHATAGNLAKTLVKQWKKLITPENRSGHRGGKQNTKKDETKSSVSKEINPSEKPKASVLASVSTCSEKTYKSRDSESQKECENKECSKSGSRHASCDTNPQAKGSDFKERTSTDSKKVSEKRCSSAANKDFSPLKAKPSKDASDQRDPKHVKKQTQKHVIKRKAESFSDEEFEPPTLPFESYLNYDQGTNKRKRKARSTGEQLKKCSEQKSSSLPKKISKFSHAREGEEDVKKCEDDHSETPNKKAKVASVQGRLNTPLPKFLTGISISSTPYAADFKAPLAPVVEAPQQVSEMLEFTGQRVTTKMQIYSGSKRVCLSKMLTLYEQCIRVLHNNIALLHQAGGVPFKVLEPVLTRCTPEELLQIEESNPVFIEESDHLWKKHCQRDFKNESRLEYKSWREMYQRLLIQREEKLKRLAKSIALAQSKKPEGRLIKQASITNAAEPPSNICRQQQIHGTAKPVTQLHPIKMCEKNIPESRGRNYTSGPVSTSNSGSSSSHVMTQREKSDKRISSIMKKTLNASNSRAG